MILRCSEKAKKWIKQPFCEMGKVRVAKKVGFVMIAAFVGG